MFCFENSEDPDQLASEKPADLDPHCFPICLLILQLANKTEILPVSWIQCWDMCSK